MRASSLNCPTKSAGRHAEQGYALIAALGMVTIIAAMTMLTATVSMRTQNSNQQEARKNQAFYAAQSGIERSISRANSFKVEVLAPSVSDDVKAANWLATKLDGTSGTLPGGRFVISTSVDASTTPLPTLIISSQGYSPNDKALRRITNAIPIKLRIETDNVDPLIGMAPAALTITGNSSINGSAPVAGDNAAPGATHDMSCPVEFRSATTCRKSSEAPNPDRYTLTYDGASMPSSFVPGRALRPTVVATGQRSEERYLVNKITTVGTKKTVEMTVLSDYIHSTSGGSRRTFPATGNIEMQELNSVPAVLMPVDTDFSKTSANVRDICLLPEDKKSTGIYECGRYTLSPDHLFEMIMGGTKANIQAKFEAMNSALPGSYHTSNNSLSCTGPAAQWFRLSTSTMNLDECSKGKLIVVDARGLSGSSLDINIPTQETFKGLLYVIAKPGVNVKIAGNVGFAGAMVMDNGNGGIDMTGNGNFNEDCFDVADEDNLKKDPKLCYDANILGDLKSDYTDTYIATRRAEFDFASSNWKEVGQP